MRGHAVVLGGSLAGLTTARILTDHFRRVTVVEQDNYPLEPSPRRGLPQSRHIHFVLDRGRRELERLFPRLADDLAEAGAVSFEYGKSARILTRSGWLPPFESDLVVRACTRPLLDWLIVRYVSALPGVEIRSGSQVVRLTAEPSAPRVTGVVIRTAGRETSLSADLVVDATGRVSRAPEWLAALGYRKPADVSIDSRLTYCCRYYAPPHDVRWDWMMMSALPQPPDIPRSGVIFPVEGGLVEGGRWVSCLAVMGDSENLPNDDEAYLQFAAKLPNRQIHEALRSARPLSPVFKRGRTPNRLRRYEQLRRFPDGFVVLGDAVCALNPIYGQGITVAVLAAVMLGREARRPLFDRSGFSRYFQRALAHQNAPAWNMAISSDLLWPGTISNLPAWNQLLVRWAAPLVSSLSRRITQAAAGDPVLARALMEIMHMSRQASALLTPGMLKRIIRSKPRQAAAESAYRAPATL